MRKYVYSSRQGSSIPVRGAGTCQSSHSNRVRSLRLSQHFAALVPLSSPDRSGVVRNLSSTVTAIPKLQPSQLKLPWACWPPLEQYLFPTLSVVVGSEIV